MKVFFIGSSKMGTTSITNALKEKGLRVTHTPHFGVYSHLTEPNEAFFSKFDYFLDGSLHNFHHLTTWFPDAKIVLLDREPSRWILSMFNWFSHIDERHMSDDKAIVRLSRLIMGKTVYRQILIDWLIYRKRVLHFFKDDPRFIHISIEDGPNEWKRLMRHLDIQLEIKWDNKQDKKSNPEWVSKIVTEAENKAKHASVVYPEVSQQSIRDRLFLYAMEVLRKDFIRERHLVKNIKAAGKINGWSHLKTYRTSLTHIFKFARVVGCLGLRIVVNRSNRLSPYIY
ncbi:sulfotransferase [Imperialibacter roseus]|uniref:Sulfotransferase n=1 Tax=Imperialibacter roseus TaxID=1324217 RepID=A0ABZ0IUY2_9BACT|nr:sulfotransferase [Imperialibacter roseus]WOK08581.1 sulfotransferase [Imperialibacter roseus]|tara:strand:- start:21777 stop:22628 length:852 start_codon:yes stop_codon:yes gene_type:complete